MPKIVLFCEDRGHEMVINAITKKVFGDQVKIKSLSARGGKGRALNELRRYMADLVRGSHPLPDAVIGAIDANCSSYNKKREEIDNLLPNSLGHIQFIHAIPDPHIERWLLLDSHAFKQVFGKGCSVPDQKCAKDRYKTILREEIERAGGVTLLGGIEHAELIIENMDIHQARKADLSFNKFIGELEHLKKFWSLL